METLAEEEDDLVGEVGAEGDAGASEGALEALDLSEVDLGVESDVVEEDKVPSVPVVVGRDFDLPCMEATRFKNMEKMARRALKSSSWYCRNGCQ